MVAFILGFFERLSGDAFGRTWPDDQDKNEAYDRGRNLAERLMGSQMRSNLPPLLAREMCWSRFWRQVSCAIAWASFGFIAAIVLGAFGICR